MSIQIHESRQEILGDEFNQPYFQDIKAFLTQKKEEGVTIYPPGSLIFNAFNLTPFDEVKVVILGQDPYHGMGQAHGLCFSVPDGVRPPPSLKNIYKEIIGDIPSPPLPPTPLPLLPQGTLSGSAIHLVPNGEEVRGEPDSHLRMPLSGNLEHWARQGVFLLNAILTVTASQPASHQNIGRERFTDTVMKKISDEKEGVIFLLRGNFARQKKALIDTTKHIVLETTHPSPFSAHKGFLGSKHFSMTNQLLEMQGKESIKRL